ncbi:putative T7SS-secreted protein [Nocardia salmonicida]|uniref:putative T7SS-secreted protein n=1 Tax=Nocardia salmonicida TaxID=53431 RepID=UPI003787F678
MGLGDFIDKVGSAIEDGVEDLAEGAGQVIDDGLDVVGDAAGYVGLDSVDDALDDLGDNIASATGGDVEEEELGQTEDPKALILGEPSEIGSAAETLKKMAEAIESTGQALQKIDAADWTGEGADAFNQVYDKQPKLWFEGGDAMTAAAGAMEAWQNEVKAAQDKAATAVERWKAAHAEEVRQKNWWNSLTGKEQRQNPLVDTWTSLRNDAREILRGARVQRDNGASIANSALSAATEKAPKEPPFTDRWIANISDLGGVLEHGALNFSAGLLTSLTGLVQFVRQVNPTDIYNITHPADYAKGLSDLGTGLVVAVADPGAAVSAIVKDARANPFEFVGALTGDALLTAATGGGGSAKVAISALKKATNAGRRLPGSGPSPHSPSPHSPNPSPHSPSPTREVDPTRATSPPGPEGQRQGAGLPTSDRGPTPEGRPVEGAPQREAPTQRTEDSGDGYSPTPEHTEPRHSEPPAQTDRDQPSPTTEPTSNTRDPDPARPPEPTQAPDRTPDADPQTSRPEPRPEAAGTSTPDPTPTQQTDHTPTQRTDPTPTQQPDHTPTQRTDPTPDQHTDRTPTQRTDPTPTQQTDHTPTQRTDPTPNQQTDHTPTQRTDPASTHHTNPDSPATSHGDSPRSQADPDTRSHTDQDTAPTQHSDPDRTSREDGSASDNRVNPTADRAPHTNDAPADVDSRPTVRTDPTPQTSSPTPPAAGWQPGHSINPDNGPAPRPTPDAHPARTHPGATPAGPSHPPQSPRVDSTPQRPQHDPGTEPHKTSGSPRAGTAPDSPGRANGHSPLAAGPHPDSPTRSTPGHTPTRADAESPSRARPDSDGRGPDHGPDKPRDRADGRSPEHEPAPKDRTPERDPTKHTDHTPDRRPNDPATPRDRTPDRDPDTHPDRDSPTDRTPDRDRDSTSPTKRIPERDHDPDSPRDRTPDRDHETDRDADPDRRTAQDRADADRDAHEHARESGAESDRTPDQKTCSEDPVDIGTGEFLLPETDLDLPAVLPMTLQRAHHSNYRFGRWFGPSWSSTLDARIVVEDAGVTFIGENAMMLAYPHSEVGVATQPLTEGQQWSLTRTDTGGYRVWDQRREVIWHFAPEPGHDGLEARHGNYAISAITDRHHNRLRFHYDADGVPVEVTHSGGYRVRIDSDRTRITGLSLISDDPDLGEFATPVLEFTYADADLIAVTDAVGATTSYTYDAEHRMISWTDSNGNQMVNSYDEFGRVAFQRGTAGMLNCDYLYRQLPDGAGRLTAVTDSLGATTSHGFDRELQLRDLVDPAGGHTHIDYNADRRPLTITGPDGATTQYRYNGAGDPTTIIRPDGYSTEIDYLWRNRPTTITSPDGSISRQEWSATGDLTAIVGATDDDRTEFTYHPNGALATVVEPNGARTTIEVDAAGLVAQVTEPDGAVTHFRRDAAGRPVQITDSLGAVTRYDWTPTGNLLRRTDPDGHGETWTYDGEGNTLTHTDRVGGLTRFSYGTFDLLHSRIDPDGSITRYTWDTERRLIAVHNPIGQRWTYEYDSAGRLVAETDFSGATTRYTLDRAGRLAAITPATGTTRHFRHDLLGRVTEITTDGDWIRYTHDPAGRVLSAVNGVGATATHALEFAYDAAGSLASQRLDDQPPMLFEHDDRGHRIQRTTPSGAVSRWHHDFVGRMDRLSADGHDITFGYDPLGRLTNWRIGELAVTRGHSGLGQLADQEVTAFPAQAVSLDSGSTTRPAPHRLRRDEFTYRPDGYLTTHTIARAQTDLVHRDYSLDAVGRVTAVSTDGAPTERYAYDALSNIVSSSTPAAGTSQASASRIPPADDDRREYRDNLLVRDGRTRFHYDPAGRLIRKTTVRLSRKPDVWHYRYNAFDQLTDVWTPDHQWWHYTYDALGRRTTKQQLTTGGAVLERVDYVWDGLHLIEQATRAATTRWHYQPGSHAPLTQSTDGAAIDREFYAIITDLVGAPTELIDPGTAHPAATAGADLWGRTTWRGKASSPLRFPGQIHDPETGLHYNMFRYYNPDTGQYLTADPLGLSPAPNPYAYTTNPLRFIDPLGLTPAACERFENFRRQVTPDELSDAPAPYEGGRPGHAWDKHMVSREVQASILNNPDRIFSGTYHGTNHITGEPYTRQVDIYFRAGQRDTTNSLGSVVITEAGNKSSVVTAYGLIDGRPGIRKRPVNADKNWANDPDYVEIRLRDDIDEVVFPDRASWEGNNWQ